MSASDESAQRGFMTMMREGAADPATPPRGRRRLFVATITVLLCGALTALATDRGFDARDDHHRADDRGEGHSAYAIGLWGDVPYSVAQEATGLPALIADMNSQNLAFTANDGDLKAGSNSLRDDALYARSRATFNSLRAPAIFTPGDNDWTDCDRVSNGSFSSLERLDHERQVFFSTPFSLDHFRIRPGRAGHAVVQDGGGLRAVRREPPVDGRRRHLRDPEHPGLVQQPLWRRARCG
jgi:hypothetical protein